MDAACHKCTTSVRKILLERSGNTSGLTSENHTRRPCSREEPLRRAPVAARVLAVTTHRPHHVPHRRPSGRPLRALVALLGAALLLTACTESPPLMPLEPLGLHAALVEEIAGALEAEGVLEADSTEFDERWAHRVDGECLAYARDAHGATVETQPGLDVVSTAVDPTLEDNGFAPLEETSAYGGHLQMESTDDQGARVQIIWKAHRLQVSIGGRGDLSESGCTDRAVAWAAIGPVRERSVLSAHRSRVVTSTSKQRRGPFSPRPGRQPTQRTVPASASSS